MQTMARVLVGVVLTIVSPLETLPQVSQQKPMPAGLVTCDVFVQKRSTGQAITGLDKDDFEIYEDDVKQSIEKFNSNGLPASVVLLLDLSRSMEVVAGTIREPARAVWNQLGPDDEIAIMTFAKNVDIVLPLTNDERLLSEQIARIYSGPDRRDRGQTSLDEAIYQAAAYLAAHSSPSRERSILIISDGQTNQEHGHSRKQAFQELFKDNCVIYSLSVSVPGLVFLDTALGDYAAETGGLSLIAESRELPYQQNLEVSEKLDVLLNLLHKRYRISYLPRDSKTNRKYRKVKIQLSPALQKRLGKVNVLYRRGYYTQ